MTNRRTGGSSASPWGPEDEIGRLNSMTPKSQADVLLKVDGSQVFDLSVEHFLGMPTWVAAGDPGYEIWMTHTPCGTIVDDLVGDPRDRVARHLTAVDLGQVLLDLPRRQPPRVQRDHVARQTLEPPLILDHRLRLERPLPVARDPQLDLADLGRHRLVIGAVTPATRPTALGALMRPVTEVLGHLDSSPVCNTCRIRSVSSPPSPVSATPSSRARATSSSAHSRIDSGSPGRTSSRPAASAGSSDPCAIVCAPFPPAPSGRRAQTTSLTRSFGQTLGAQ